MNSLHLEFPGLSADIGAESSLGAKRVLIVTQDIIGPVKNGGIGTAYFYAATELANMGHNVTILFSLGGYSASKHISHWVDVYAEKGIKFVPCPEPEVAPVPGVFGECCKVQYRVYEWLKEREGDFDVVHASEWGADLYYCLLAKKLNLRFAHIHFVIKASSPLLWNRLGNNDPIKSFMYMPRIYMERKCIELADTVISGSRYMLNWMRQNGYRLPLERCFVQPNIFPEIDESEQCKAQTLKVMELVFFGRLERRKGLHLYLDAVSRLIREKGESALVQFQFTFLGKFKNDFDAKGAIKATFSDTGLKYSILSDFSQPKAIDYLRSRLGVLAVIPSVIDNSPFGIYELLGYRIPFITSTAGGGQELLHVDDKAHVLFEPHPHSIYLKLVEVIDRDLRFVRPGFDMVQSLRTWDQWHRSKIPDKCSGQTNIMSGATNVVMNSPASASESPKVSICLAHYNRPVELAQAIESIENLEYDNFELIIVDDGSSYSDALEFLETLKTRSYKFPLKVLSQPNLYLGASRNLAAKNAEGEFLLFMDDDNLAKPNELRVLVSVAQSSGADVLTCFSDLFLSYDTVGSGSKENSRVLFVGPDLASGLIRNPFGDSNCLVRRSSFYEISGFTEDYKVGRDDQDFFARAVIRGYSVEVVPEALYWYRISKNRMRKGQFSAYAGLQRVCSSYVGEMNLPPELSNILRYAQGMASERSWLSGGFINRLAQRNSLKRLLYKYPAILNIIRPIVKKLL